MQSLLFLVQASDQIEMRQLTGVPGDCPMMLISWRTGDNPERVAVIRDAFTGSHDLPQSLATSVASLGPGSVAVASGLSQYHRRLVADEYGRAPDGSYSLHSVATDLLRHALCLVCNAMPGSRLDKCGARAIMAVVAAWGVIPLA